MGTVLDTVGGLFEGFPARHSSGMSQLAQAPAGSCQAKALSAARTVSSPHSHLKVAEALSWEEVVGRTLAVLCRQFTEQGAGTKAGATVNAVLFENWRNRPQLASVQ